MPATWHYSEKKCPLCGREVIFNKDLKIYWCFHCDNYFNDRMQVLKMVQVKIITKKGIKNNEKRGSGFIFIKKH